MAGKTVAEATEQALDQLGVASGDAEVIVVSEPKTGLFGRVRVEARVRARVRPVGVRPKRERSRDRDRDRGRSGRSRRGGSSKGGGQGGQGGRTATKTRPAETAGGRSGVGGTGVGGKESGGTNGATGGSTGTPGAGSSRSARRRRNRSQAAGAAAAAGSGADASDRNGQGTTPAMTEGLPARNASQGNTDPKETEDMAEGMTLEEQGEAGKAFLTGLLAEFGMSASVEARLIDEDTVEVAAIGEELGMLVGPRGSTLSALQDLARAVVQRQCPSRTDRILVDVAGYREKRSAALKRFSTQIAEEVLASGQEKALEAMSPADRKAIHDAVNDLDGVVTRSEGEDPHRYIVIAPAG